MHSLACFAGAPTRRAAPYTLGAEGGPKESLRPLSRSALDRTPTLLSTIWFLAALQSLSFAFSSAGHAKTFCRTCLALALALALPTDRHVALLALASLAARLGRAVAAAVRRRDVVGVVRACAQRGARRGWGNGAMSCVCGLERGQAAASTACTFEGEERGGEATFERLSLAAGELACAAAIERLEQLHQPRLSRDLGGRGGRGQR